MKKFVSYLLFSAFLFTFTHCNQTQKKAVHNNNSYPAVKQKVKPAEILKEKTASWVKKGTICYGIIVATNKNGKQEFGKPVKAEIIEIKNGRIKMKSLEDIHLEGEKRCKKLTISSGTTWWEKDGDIFKTKAEAISFLKQKKLLKHNL